jgi:hypothetical protein
MQIMTVAQPSGCRLETPSKTWSGLSAGHVGILADVLMLRWALRPMSTCLDVWSSKSARYGASSAEKSVEMSLDAADTSVRATLAWHGLS